MIVVLVHNDMFKIYPLVCVCVSSQLCAERCLLSKEQGDMDQYLKTWLPTSTHFNGQYSLPTIMKI